MNLLTTLKGSSSTANARKSFLYLSLIMILACTIVMGIITMILYDYELDKQKEMLQVTAQSQARLLESIASKEIETATLMARDALYYDHTQAAIDQIADAHDRYEGFGSTGEFTLARREDDQIVFVLRHRYEDVQHPEPVDFSSDLAEPMRLALQGLSGTLIGLDYRGETVLAAYEPVDILDLGIVAKMDLSEIRAPFIRAVLLGVTAALFVVLLGTGLFFRIGNPIIEKLEAYSSELEKEVDLRNDLNLKLKSTNKELERIVYVSSHDLRSPLVNIDGYSRELERSIEEIAGIVSSNRTPSETVQAIQSLLNDDVTEALHFIRTSAGKMDVLLTGLLKLSRLGRSALSITLLDMNQLIRKALDARDFQLKETGITVDIGDLPSCMGDRVQVDQLFSNLLDNAINYLDKGRPGKISVKGRVEDGNSIYSVEDNGVGIAPDHIKNIFEIFHRLNPDASEGEGLGLAIVQQALSKLAGKIMVESEPGVGSCFYIYLPAAE